MEIPVETLEKVPEGERNGVIKEVMHTKGEFDYMDYHIQIDGTSNFVVKVGFPTSVKVDKSGAPASLHAHFLHKMGALTGERVNPELLKDRRVAFTLLYERSKKDGNDYARIIRETLRPI